MDDLFAYFLSLEPQITNYETDKLAFLDRGYTSSSWADQIDRFRERLTAVKVSNYPHKGKIPDIDCNFLSFLHPDITEACLCVVQQNNCHWFGRRPLDRVQMWSATKFLPVYYLLSYAPSIESPHNWQIKDNTQSFFLPDLVDLIFTYDDPLISSNSLALMLKRFYPPSVLEHWLHCLTGNDRSIFQGGYGEQPFLEKPVLTTKDGQPILATNFDHNGQNLVSAYDLTRALTHLAWIDHTDRYDVLIKAMAKDSARYLDVALEKRSLTNIQDVVILSKMGFGRSDEREQMELVYTALLSSRELSLCLTYKSATRGTTPPAEAKYLDARMVTEVTKTIDRLG